MKLLLFICALLLSLHGWCSAVIPVQRTARTTTSSHQAIDNGKLKKEISRPSLSDKMKTTVIGWGILVYLTVVIGWAIKARNSLDKTLKEVLQDMAQYP